VTRNRVKRWLREAVRAVPGPRAGPWDLVLIPRSEAADVGLVALSSEVGELFARVAR
jgi:ribonuclease P protein component